MNRRRPPSARRLAVENGIAIIWQRPCFEAMLLRHLPGRTAHRPPDTAGAAAVLRNEWPDYSKPMTRAALAPWIDLAAVLRAASVEPELAGLLRRLGLI